MSYTVSFQSGGVETSPTIPGKTSIDLPQSVVDSTSTSLVLTGKGVPNYGQIQQDNFVRLLENFASKTSPLNPTIGQIWFDSTASTLKVYGMDSQWHATGAVTASATAPLNPQVGELWYDITHSVLNVWNGTAWVPVGGLLASPTPPSPAVEGMLWYSTTDRVLYLKVNPANSSVDYPRYIDNTWEQVFPASVPYALTAEYNALAARINRVIGAPSVLGVSTNPADNQYGWGQTDLLEVFTDMNTPTPFDNTKWVTMASRLRKAIRHTSGDETTVPAIGYIRDGRGPSALATQYTPNVTWVSGWAGSGIAGVAAYWTSLQNAVTALENTRFTINTTGGSQIANLHSDQTVGSTWASTRVLVESFKFANHAAAEAFFNAGAAARFTISLSSGVGLGNTWFNAIHGANLDSSGFVVDYKGSRIGFSGAYIGGTASIGFYGMTTTFQTLYTLNISGPYGSGTLVIEGNYDPSTAIMLIRLNFNETFTPGQSISQLTVAADIRDGVTAFGGLPHLDTPAVAAPVVTTSGTFLTAPAGT